MNAHLGRGRNCNDWQVQSGKAGGRAVGFRALGGGFSSLASLKLLKTPACVYPSSLGALPLGQLNERDKMAALSGPPHLFSPSPLSLNHWPPPLRPSD